METIQKLFLPKVVLFVVALSFFSRDISSKGKVENLIQQMRCTKNTVEIAINPRIKAAYLTADFFATYDETINLEKMPYEIVTMPFICNIISLIWISGQKYYIDSMDMALYKSLKTVKKIFQLSYPRTQWDGELIPKQLVTFIDFSPSLPSEEKKKKRVPTKITTELLKKHQGITRINYPKILWFKDQARSQQNRSVNKNNPPRRALLFSGGLDSTSSLFAHNDEKLLLITCWGQYDCPLMQENVWRERKRKIIETAERYGHDTTFIKSNYTDFLNWKYLNTISPDIENWRCAAVDGIGWAGLVAPVFFAKGCSELYVASSNSWYYPYIDCINPFVDHSIEFANYKLKHDQFDYTRQDKALFIAQTCKERSLERPFIKVCQHTRKVEDKNCCKCRKCLTTILALCAAGDDHRSYGFPISLQLAVRRTLKLMSRPITHETAWNFTDTQQTMKELKQTYSSVVLKALTPFLDYNMKSVEIVNRKYALKVDWRDYAKLVPSVKIPSNLSPKKLAINVP